MGVTWVSACGADPCAAPLRPGPLVDEAQTAALFQASNSGLGQEDAWRDTEVPRAGCV